MESSHNYGYQACAHRDFHEAADKTVYTVTIPGILEEKSVMKRDKDGKPLQEVPAIGLGGTRSRTWTTLCSSITTKELANGICRDAKRT